MKLLFAIAKIIEVTFLSMFALLRVELSESEVVIIKESQDSVESDEGGQSEVLWVLLYK